ncbi:MAG: glycosyltransferase, partial [Myxococcota bacterium]
MNIAVNARFFTQQFTGVQRYASELSGRIAARTGAQLLAPDAPTGDHRYSNLRVTATGRLHGHLWEQLDLPLFLRRAGTPLLLNLANTAPLAYRRQIVTVHDLAFMRNPAWFSRGFALYYNFLIPRVVRSALAVITVSEFSKREIVGLTGVPAEKVHVVYNAASAVFAP